MPENAAAKAASHLTIVTSTEGDATIDSLFRQAGRRLDGSSAEPGSRLLPGSKRIVLDLADLGYMDSWGSAPSSDCTRRPRAPAGAWS